MHEEDDDAHDDEEEGVGVEHQDLQALLGGKVGLGVGVTAADVVPAREPGKFKRKPTSGVKHFLTLDPVSSAVINKKNSQ